MTIHPYIAIEGPIGVGKTTLARILGEALPGEILLEVFEQNPFLSDFYTDRARYAFQTQIFFLLSRYRQQHQVIADTIRRTALVSDYLFAKDWLFAHLNLEGDELSMYERVHAILGERIPTPGLVVYLRAPTETLMQRIALRDRPYERQMDPEYMHSLRLAYNRFFENYTTAPVLHIETENLDYVRDLEARSAVVGQVRAALRSASAAYQPRLIDAEPASDQLRVSPPGGRLADWQHFQAATGAGTGTVRHASVFADYLALTAQVGAVGGALAQAWQETERQLAQLGNQAEARDRALTAVGEALAEGLGEALGRLLQLANDAGIDLENAYLQRMKQRQ